LTFDDGPNATTTLALRDILDRAGVKATFFTVGKALDARPDISAALLADGQLLGNHSYHHDSWRWLDPRYPELARTQHAFADRLDGHVNADRTVLVRALPGILDGLHQRGLEPVRLDVLLGTRGYLPRCCGGGGEAAAPHPPCRRRDGGHVDHDVEHPRAGAVDGDGQGQVVA